VRLALPVCLFPSDVFTRFLVCIVLFPSTPRPSYPIVFSLPNTRSCINTLLYIAALLDSQFYIVQLRSFNSDTSVRTEVQSSLSLSLSLSLSVWSYFKLILWIICTPNTLSVTKASYYLLAKLKESRPFNVLEGQSRWVK
jgi:hypothetical protein